ncbi:MAG TPA: hypothetical protein VMC43_03955 [Candidatus Paceibacterota bacterium]|nr:hypothetical protein [Candidatus Paceibacterota bacterium]
MDQKQFEELKKKIDAARKDAGIDLSKDEDLSIGVMNLISLEEHFFMTGEKTGKPEYFDLLNEVRAVRKEMLQKLLPKEQHEGETWCISKHLLATTMRLMEVGTKLQGDGQKEKAKEMFDAAYRIYSLFWGLRLKLIDVKGIKETAATDKPWSLQDIVGKLVDCCDE